MNDVSRWFGEYLDVFAACGRCESDTRSLRSYCGVPVSFATDDAFVALTSEDHVVAAAQQQIDGMRAAGYDHSDIALDRLASRGEVGAAGGSRT